MLATWMLENRRNRRWRGRYDGIRLCSGGDRCAASVPRTRRRGGAGDTPGRREPCRKSPTAGRGVGRSPAPASARIISPSATSSLPRQGCALARNRTDLDSPATCFVPACADGLAQLHANGVTRTERTTPRHAGASCVRAQVALRRLRRTRVCAGWRRRQPGPTNPEFRPYNAQSTRTPATSALGRSRVRDGSLNWSGCTM